MNRVNIGIVFILVGAVYSMMAWDFFYDHTLGWLVANDFVKPRFMPPKDMPSIGRKAAILLYGSTMIAIGLYIIFFSGI